MELDPYVLLAYLSISINLITLVAAAAAYAAFRIRKRRGKATMVDDLPASGSFNPVFLKSYRPVASFGESATAEAEKTVTTPGR